MTEAETIYALREMVGRLNQEVIRYLNVIDDQREYVSDLRKALISFACPPTAEGSCTVCKLCGHIGHANDCVLSMERVLL